MQVATTNSKRARKNQTNREARVNRFERPRTVLQRMTHVFVAAGLLLFLVSLQAETPPRTFKLTANSPKLWDLVDRDANLKKVAGDFGFTEGPVWDESGFLYVSDEEKNKIYRVFPDGRKEEVISLGDPDGNT